MDFDRDVLEVFTASCLEQLADIEQQILGLEQGSPHFSATVDAIFRSAHSIKADAAAMGFEHISRLAHLAEDVLHAVRTFHLRISPALIDALLAVFDCLRRMAEAPLVTVDAAPCLIRMNQALMTGLAAAMPGPEQDVTPVSSGVSSDCDGPGAQIQRPEQGFRAAQLSIAAVKLDSLVDQLGELSGFQARLRVLAQSQSTITALCEELERLVADLRDQVMGLRMVPLRSVFAKLRRVVRDVAGQTGKQIVLTVSGEDTELDKSVIEHLHGPLTHVLRNAVDHGIEVPAQRRRAGKAPEGHVSVSALQIGGEVEIQINDDGQGIDGQAMRRAAEAKGLVSPGQALSAQEIVNLAFLPGLSTSQTVSAYSGRGVGMDAAQEGIAALRGAISLDSTPGQGTSVRIRVPLSLAILDTLQIAVGQDVFFIPIEHLVECLDLRRSTTVLHAGRGMITVRGTPLPVVCLASFFGLEDTEKDLASVVVVRAGELRMGLIVSALMGHRQIILKQIKQITGHLAVILGGAITEDGSFALVLDTPALLRSCLGS
ncbi:MAG: chemotaxis protein CheA [Desulfovibrionales bacterium]|nr:chemotaxis protein CheA [Desulfovibrionales bacterium]